MTTCLGAARGIGLPVVALVVLTFCPASLDVAAANPAQALGKARDWPCRIIVVRPLLQVVEGGWKGSKTFRRQCEALANKGAIAILRPGDEASGFSAQTRIGVTTDGFVVGRVMVPLNTKTLEYIAHELEHILERAEGVDLPRESQRGDSGVWRIVDSFETQRAIDTGRQVAREVRESSGKPSR